MGRSPPKMRDSQAAGGGEKDCLQGAGNGGAGDEIKPDTFCTFSTLHALLFVCLLL